jgi:thymidine kinase
VTDGPQVEIGGNERYVSVSRPEFKRIVAGVGRIELQQPQLSFEPREPAAPAAASAPATDG